MALDKNEAERAAIALGKALQRCVESQRSVDEIAGRLAVTLFEDRRSREAFIRSVWLSHQNIIGGV